MRDDRHTASPEEQEHLRSIIRSVGVDALHERLGLPKQTLVRLAAGACVQRATLVWLRWAMRQDEARIAGRPVESSPLVAMTAKGG